MIIKPHNSHFIDGKVLKLHRSPASEPARRPPDAWGRLVLKTTHGPLDYLDVLRMTNADRVGAMIFADALPIPPPMS